MKNNLLLQWIYWIYSHIPPVEIYERQQGGHGKVQEGPRKYRRPVTYVKQASKLGDSDAANKPAQP